MRYNSPCVCGRSSSGRARPCQGRGSEFEPRRPLQKKKDTHTGVFLFLERRFCAAKSVACGRMTERARETRLRFPLHTFLSLRWVGVRFFVSDESLSLPKVMKGYSAPRRGSLSSFCLRRPLFFQQRKKRGKETPPKTTFLDFLARFYLPLILLVFTTRTLCRANFA